MQELTFQGILLDHSPSACTVQTTKRPVLRTDRACNISECYQANQRAWKRQRWSSTWAYIKSFIPHKNPCRMNGQQATSRQIKLFQVFRGGGSISFDLLMSLTITWKPGHGFIMCIAYLLKSPAKRGQQQIILSVLQFIKCQETTKSLWSPCVKKPGKKNTFEK